MYACNFVFILVLSFILFKNTVTAKGCKRKEDCSKQLEGEACSFCVGETGSAQCIYPFPELYLIEQSTLECKRNVGQTNICQTKNPCENGGICRDDGHFEDTYVCECKQNYVGRHCEIKYDKIKLFHVHNIDFQVLIAMCSPTEVEVEIMLPKDELLDKVKVMAEDSYFVGLRWVSDSKCNSFGCTRKYQGDMRFLYKPYSNESKDFLYLGKNVLGYLTHFKLDIVHKGKTIFTSEYKVFVSYPEKNICVPVAQLSEYVVDYNEPTLYNRKSRIIISPSLDIIPLGNSRTPFKEMSKGLCGSVSEINLTWKIWWLKSSVWVPDTLAVEVFKERSITLRPLTNHLEFGTYRVELEVRNFFSEGSSMTNDMFYFIIVSLPLEAIIDGGSHRSVVKKHGLLLSAVNSRDPNQLPGDQAIMAKWSCTALKRPEADIGDMCKPVTLSSTNPYFIPADLLSEGEFNFTLEVWSDLYQYSMCRQCKLARAHQFSHQTIVVTNKANLLIRCQYNCQKMVAVNSELILKVSYLDNADEISYKWSYIKVENEKKIPLTQRDDLPSYIFRIPEDTLEIGTHYIVSVSATSKDESLSAIYAFETDNFIYTGNCSVDPDSGIRGITYFDIYCTIPDIEALSFEFYDKTSKEASESVYVSGRMLGESYDGELYDTILTRGIVVVYIARGYQRVNRTYEVKLTDDIKQQDDLLNNLLHNPLYFINMPPSRLMLYTSSLPDIITNNSNHKAFLNILLQNLTPDKIIQMEDVKLNSLVLYNILSRLGRGNMDFNSVKTTRRLVVRMTEIFQKSIHDRVTALNSREIKDIIATMLNILELSLTVQNETEVDGTGRYIMVSTYFDLTHSSLDSIQVLNNILTVLSVVQNSGLPPTTISSINNTFTLKILKQDPKYNLSLSKMLQRYSDVPVSISSVLMNRLQNSLEPSDKLSLCVAIVTENIFKWFNKDTVSNLLFISLYKQTKGSKVVNIREIASSIDMEMFINDSLPKVKEVGQTIPLDPTLDEYILDLQIRVHRFDSVPGGKLSVTFLYPPTNASLRVLIVGDYRPTYKMMMLHSSLITEQSPYYSLYYTITESNKFYYMGVIPGPDIPLTQSVTYSFTVSSTGCMSWERVKWSSTGCNVGPNTSDHRVHCQCSHLSIFGAVFPFLPNQIDPFADTKLYLTVLDNPLVVSIMVVLFVLYVIISILAFNMDKKDNFRGSITVLEDNFPGDQNPYLLAVYTSSRLLAGTSANVGVQLIGELANSRAHILKSKYYKVLSRGSDDWFLLLCPKPLGIIRYVHIWHDNTGLSPDWYCDKVHVYDVNSSLECLCIVEQWLELNLSNYPEALVVPASSHEVLKINRVLSDNITKCFREQGFISQTFTQHPRSTIRRVQRVNIFMCSLSVALFCSIMFYTNPSEQKPDDYTYNVKEKDLYVSYITVAVIVAVNYVISLLFNKSYKYVLLKNQSSLYLRECETLEEYFVSDKQTRHSKVLIPRPEEQNYNVKERSFRKKYSRVVKHIMKSQSLAPAMLPCGLSGIHVKKVWLTIAWATCVTIIIVCMHFIMLYGLKMGLVYSKKWLTSVAFSYINNKIVINPLTIIVMASTLTATFGFVAASSNYRVTENEIEMSVSNIRCESYEELVTRRQYPMYSPMKTEDRKTMIKKIVRVYHWIQVLRIMLSLCYIIVLVCTVAEIRSFHYPTNNHLKTMVTSTLTGHSTGSFYNSYTIVELSYYFDETFLKVIYTTRWYNMWPLFHNGNDDSSPLYWTSDYSWRMVGAPYVRQQRVYEVPCHSIAPPLNRCIPHWCSQTEDTDPYTIGWSTFASPNTDQDLSEAPWTYTHPTASWLETYYRLQGKSDVIYNNGGYKARIGSSIQETAKIVTQLAGHKWLDVFTKVVFVELTLYNVNVRSYSQVTLITEFSTTGVSLKVAKITSVVDCGGVELQHIAFTVLTFLFVLEICYRLNYGGFTKFVKDIRSVLLFVIAIPSFLVLIGFFIHTYECFVYDMWDRYYVKKYDYFDFDIFMGFHNNIVLLLSCFLLLSVWRTLLLLRALNISFMIHNLFKLSMNITFFILSLVFICFVVVWQVYLHSDVSVSNSFVDLVVSQKKLRKLHGESIGFESVVFSIIKFCTGMLISSFFITIFVHLTPAARHLKKLEENVHVKKT